MKILLVHNFYGSEAPSGENLVFEAERELLESHGQDVVAYSRHSDEIRGGGLGGLLRGAAATAWNPFARRAVRRLLEKERPDVMHVHNTFPLISPSVFGAGGAAEGSKTAVVFTLHNYRIFCASATLSRGGRPCLECLDKGSVLPALRYGCYRGSRAATLSLAAMISLHRRLGTWGKVDAFVALTDFQRERLAAAGIDGGRVFVKPHFYPDPPDPVPWGERAAKVVFAGRLDEEKGLRSLISAWIEMGAAAPELEIIGDGPLWGELVETVGFNGLGGKVRLTAALAFGEVQTRLARARLLILPSLCYEGFPMTIREAFALGTPAAVSGHGAMAALVEDGKTGVHFAPGDAGDLVRAVSGAWGNQETLAAMGEAARREFEEKYTAEANYEMLMEVYEGAILRKGRGA